MSIGNRSGGKALKTFALLDEIVTVLGSTKLALYPFLSRIGTDIFPYGSGNDAPVLTANSALEADFDPIPLAGGVYGLYSNPSAAELTAPDDADFSHAGDTAFSCGAWVSLNEAVGSAVRTIVSKYDATTGSQAREYHFFIDGSGQLVLELYDESTDSTEIGTGGTGITPFTWQFCVATYDGTAATPSVHLYINGTDTNSDGATTEAGSGYVAMEDLGALFRVGAFENTSGVAGQTWNGYIALPFITGKELTSAEVTTIYNIGRQLVGV